MHFASDNTAPVPPQVLEALIEANHGYAMPYGTELAMTEVRDQLRQIFEAPEAEIYLVATGTAANALALACLCPPWATIYCHPEAHIEEDECAAPEFYTGGAKLTLVEGDHGKIAPGALEQALAFTGRAGVHNVQKGALSLTNTTEAGTVYTPGEVATLIGIAHAHGLPVHMDGARFANALVTAGCTPAELTWKAGVDVLCLGGTKNGLMGVEAVILFDPARAWEFELRRKRGGHLFSKHRYLSAQMAAWLNDDLWLKLAERANTAARRLSDGIAALPGAHLVHPTQANSVFAAWPREGHRRAQEAGAQYYLWPMDQSLEGPGDAPLSARLVCSWCTTEEDVDSFLALISG
ncbi:threonine aldolase family protein [Rhodovulum adriaticum]|uniref:L-threonine aldolase n=1 Tax=Rhodovulum adriaticum TaxID=35804 RepID=A0A4R2NY10_RHOAD|nr:beta-eliminating lyase-related protein [Rhodovulum adriaticum]MBK1635275.1 low specificity L-threonine aldolase [Rhodovulum adriaticum]TCP26411.1 L-threonine aldolase [Rhodovulum adriaticum]